MVGVLPKKIPPIITLFIGLIRRSEKVWEEVGRLTEKVAKLTREFDIKSPSVLLDGAILILKIMDCFRETAGKHP